MEMVQRARERLREAGKLEEQGVLLLRDGDGKPVYTGKHVPGLGKNYMTEQAW